MMELELVFNDYSNKTKFGLKSVTERYAWIFYSVFVILSSMIGDSLILIASIKYKAFKINKLIEVTIQHIAVSDLCVTVSTILPRTVALVLDDQIFGSILCKIRPYYVYYFSTVGMYLVCTMVTCKVATLQYPLRTRLLGAKDIHKVCFSVWLSVLTLPAVLLADFQYGSVFDYRVYACEVAYKAAVWKWLRSLTAAVFTGIPNVLVITSTIRLLIITKQAAARRKKSVNPQGVATIILVAVIYHISLLPYAIYNIAGSLVPDKTSSFHNEFFKVSVCFLSFNIISNFFVYCLTIKSFRQFLKANLDGFRLKSKTFVKIF